MTYKLSYRRDGEWIECNRAPVFTVDRFGDGAERLVVGVPNGSDIFRLLAQRLSPPYDLLYVLHTSRGEGEEGRYQSPPLGSEGFADFCNRFAAFLSGDARHDLWLRSEADQATLVWDRHNLLYVYGPLERLRKWLVEAGFASGGTDADFLHMHHYRAEFDRDAAALLDVLDWTFSPLRPEDRQHPPPDGG